MGIKEIARRAGTWVAQWAGRDELEEHLRTHGIRALTRWQREVLDWCPLSGLLLESRLWRTLRAWQRRHPEADQLVLLP